MKEKFPAALVLLLLIAAVFANSLSIGFTLDSAAIIRDDPRVQHFCFDSLRRIFTTHYWHGPIATNHYRPLTTLSFMLNTLLGNSPASYHLVNLLIHWINALLIAALARRFLSPLPALGVACLFAAHPLTVETVTNLVDRSGMLAVTFCLIGIHLHIRRRRLLVGACGLIAVLFKESGVMLAGLVLAWDLCFGGFQWRTYAALAPSWFTILITRWMFVPEIHTLGQTLGVNPLPMLGWFDRLLTAAGVQGRYLGLFFWPRRLSCDYSFHSLPLGTESWTVFAWIGVAIAAAVFLWFHRRNRPAIFFALAFGAAMAPVSNLFFLVGTAMAERFMYLPAACLAFIVVACLRPPPPLIGALVIALGIRSAQRNPDWRDDLSIWQSAANLQPGNFKAHQETAAEMLVRNEISPRAIAHARRAVDILQGLPVEQRPSRAYLVLATLLTLNQELTQAKLICLQAFEIERAVTETYNRRQRAAGKPTDELRDPEIHKLYDIILWRLGETGM